MSDAFKTFCKDFKAYADQEVQQGHERPIGPGYVRTKLFRIVVED